MIRALPLSLGQALPQEKQDYHGYLGQVWSQNKCKQGYTISFFTPLFWRFSRCVVPFLSDFTELAQRETLE